MGLQNEKIEALSFVTAELNYLGPLRNRPRTYAFEPPSGEPKTNTVPEPHALPIHDVRPIAESVSLDRHGFALARQKSAVKNVDDDEEVRASIIGKPSSSSKPRPAPIGYSSSTILYASESTVRRTCATAPRANRLGVCMWIIPPDRGRSAFAISFPRRRMNC